MYKSNESLAKRSTVNIKPIRIEKQQNTVDFTIFPNPAKDLISLTISTKSVDQNLTMSIIDIVGKKVVSDNIIKGVKDQSQINVDVSTLSNGVYFCVLLDQFGDRLVKKFIIAE